MIDPTNRPPLWEAMDAARFLALRRGCNNGVAVAAELRAIAGRIKDDFAACIVGDDPVMEVVDWLRAEADKAEAGG
jgi:hypothetical protein